METHEICCNILESTRDAFIVVNSLNNIIHYNKTAEKIFANQCQPDSEKSVKQFIKDIFGPEGLIILSQEPEVIYNLTAYQGTKREFPAEVSLFKVKLDEEDCLVLSIRDVTERLQAQQGISRLHSYELLFNNVAAEFALSKDVEQSIQYTVQAICENLKAERVTLWKLSPRSQSLILKGEWQVPELDRRDYSYIVKARRLPSDPNFVSWRAEASKHGYVSSIALPLIANDDESLGSLNIYAEEGTFDTEEVKLLTEMAGDLAYGIMSLRARAERKQIEEDLRKSVDKIQRILEQTVDALASALEIRDPYTAGHQRNVAKLACSIAEYMGLSGDQVEGLAVAGTLHDIGKITVPAEILSKPGKLSEFEFSLIKSHSQTGYEILKKIEFPWPIAQIVRQHHERMDGSGYPSGISGEDILLEARILAVADVVEAMASHRPYRSALGINKALEEISQNSGVLYDPEVVETCVKLFTDKKFKFKGNGRNIV